MTTATDLDSMTDAELQAFANQNNGVVVPKPQSNIPDFDSMTNDELLAYATQLEEDGQQENVYTDLSEYYGDRIQSGITSTPSMAGAVWRTFLADPAERDMAIREEYQKITGTSLNREFRLADDGSDEVLNGLLEKYSEDAEKPLYQEFGENFMNYQHGYQNMLGWDVDKTGKKPPNDVHRYLGSGVEAFSDPYGLLVKTGLKITNIIGRAIGLDIIGTGSEAGGDIGGAMQEAYTGKPETGTWRVGGSLISTIPAALISKPITSAAFKTTGSLYKKYKEVKSDPSSAQQAYTTTYVKGILAKIVEENPNIESILGDLNKIGIKWDGGAFPLIAAAAESPTAHSQLVKLAKTNATYRNAFMEELNRMKDLVEKNADRIFGNRYAELPWSDVAINKGLQARQQRLIQARVNIDDRIQALQDRLNPNMSELDRGMAIQKLITKRESLARAEVKPLYDDLMWRAKEAGVKIPSDAVEGFWKYIKDNDIRDLFGKGSEADIKIIKLLKPKKVKNEITGQMDDIYPELTFDQVDSLKRLINKLKRQPLDKSEMRKVMQLDDALGHTRSDGTRGGLRSLLPEEYDLELQSIDKLYYEKVGLPFNEEAIAQIGKKRYSSEVANIILKNREAIDQYLNVAGKEGPQLARDAMIAKLYSKVVVNGVVNRKILARELKKNEAVIDGIPGMKDELAKLQVDSDYLFMRMGTLDDALKIEAKKVADHFLSTSGFAPDYNTLVKGLMGSGKNLKKFMGDLDMLDPSTRNAVLSSTRREFIEIMKTQPGGAFSYLTNPKNASGINKIMGKGYAQDLKDFAKVIDAMNGIDIKKLGATIEQAELDWLAQKFPGVSTKYASSQYRDRISNPVMKMTRLISKMVDFRNKKSMDQSVFELLTDRDGMSKVNALVAKMNFKIDNPAKIKELVGTIKEILPVYMYTGLKTSVSHESEKIEQKIQ